MTRRRRVRRPRTRRRRRSGAQWITTSTMTTTTGSTTMPTSTRYSTTKSSSASSSGSSTAPSTASSHNFEFAGVLRVLEHHVVHRFDDRCALRPSSASVLRATTSVRTCASTPTATPRTIRASGDDPKIDEHAVRICDDAESASATGFANNDRLRADEPLCLFVASTSTTNDLTVRVTCCLRHRVRLTARRRGRPCVWRRRRDR